jgi:hypothetical protein
MRRFTRQIVAWQLERISWTRFRKSGIMFYSTTSYTDFIRWTLTEYLYASELWSKMFFIFFLDHQGIFPRMMHQHLQGRQERASNTDSHFSVLCPSFATRVKQGLEFQVFREELVLNPISEVQSAKPASTAPPVL